MALITFDQLVKKAKSGNLNSMSQLAKFYLDNRDYHKAFIWYKKMVKKGDAFAMYQVGVCYWNGLGVTQDDDEAIKYWAKSAKNGYSEAISFIKNQLKPELEKEMRNGNQHSAKALELIRKYYR